MPCGSRPSIAALTRSGARKASEIVMLTLRTLQPSRVAMLSAFAPGSSMSSLSQRRPRAIEAMRRARSHDQALDLDCRDSTDGSGPFRLALEQG
jgi:hypothetical protein